MGIKHSVHYHEDHGSYSTWSTKKPTKKPKKEKRKTKIPIGIPTPEKVKRGRYKCRGDECKYKLTAKAAKLCPECGIKNPVGRNHK